MNAYCVEQHTPGFWHIADRRGDCLYLIEGSEKALLIDTGMCDAPLLPVLRRLTEKPVELALTHAHIDHMYRFSEFPCVYVHEAEQTAYTAKTQRLMDLGSLICRIRVKKYPVASFCVLHGGQHIHLGGNDILCLHAGGHTPGSAIFVDSVHRAVFCGDAVGSGAGVWMFLPDCTTLGVYKQQMQNVYAQLQGCDDYAYFTGHSKQGGADFVPVTRQTFADMHDLCVLLLQKKPVEICKKLPFGLYYCKNKSAAALTRKKKMRS